MIADVSKHAVLGSAENMSYLFWNPISINMLIEIILASLIAIYFTFRFFSSLWKKKVSRTDFFLFITFVSAFLGILLQFLPYSLHPYYANYAMPWISVPAVCALAGFILFSFNFQRKQQALSFGNLFLGTVFLIQIGIEIYVALARHQLLQDGVVEYREAWIFIPIGMGFFVAHIFFMDRLITALSYERQKSWLKSIGPALLAIIWPPTQLSHDAAAARAFFYLLLVPLVMGLTLVGRSFGLIDWRLAEILNCWFFLFTLASFALVYLNYIPEHSSFKIKLVGVTLAVVLTLISGTAWLVGSVYMDAYEDKHRLAEKTAIRFKLEKNGSYSVARTPYQFDLNFGDRIQVDDTPVQMPFDFPFFGKNYSNIYPHNGGIIGFNQLPRWRNIQHQFGPQPTIFLITAELQKYEKHLDKTIGEQFQSGMFIKKEVGKVTVTWRNVVSVFSPKDKYSFQLKLYPNGVIDMVFADFPEKPLTDFYHANVAPLITGIVPAFYERRIKELQFASGLPYKAALGEGIVEYKRLGLLNYLNKIYEPIAIFILLSSLAILIIFPRFFTVSLDKPLQNLIQGVQKILDGKLATPIKISYRDEIGYLASSFNEMAMAQNELIQTLEDKVATRTAEVSEYADRNARLEERNHLSNELHDTVSQTLFSANLIADSVPALLQKDPDRALLALGDLKNLNKDALAEMRQLLLEWRSHKLSAYSLRKSLEELVKETERSEAISVILEIESNIILPDYIQHTFYRIAQECLTNISKHSTAKNVEVCFICQPNHASLSISDNGCGFAPDNVVTGSLGLLIMKDRMSKIGGKLEVTSDLAKGTVVTAIWISNDTE